MTEYARRVATVALGFACVGALGACEAVISLGSLVYGADGGAADATADGSRGSGGSTSASHGSNTSGSVGSTGTSSGSSGSQGSSSDAGSKPPTDAAADSSDGGSGLNAACKGKPAGTTCAIVGCSNGVQTTPGTCDGEGTCSGTQETCAPYVCGLTACRTMCSQDGDCTSTNYCAAPNCLPRQAAGAPCTSTDQCLSGVCDVNESGHCCKAACTPTSAPCGATACDTSGDCVFPPSTTSCGAAPSCSGNILSPGPLCSGSGTCNAAASPAPCPGDFVCASLTACKTNCAVDNDCAAGDAGSPDGGTAPFVCRAPDCMHRVIFESTGAAQSFVVPAGVTQLIVTALGAGAQTGKGASVTATIAVTPSESLTIEVGGQGGEASGQTTNCSTMFTGCNGASCCIPGPGGFNGGGTGGTSGYWAGNGGGGASDVRRGGSMLTSRVVVAAGAGGDGLEGAAGGSGGTTTPIDGVDGACGPGSGGKGATPSAGGAAGTGCATPPDPTAGVLGVGGVGGGPISQPTCYGGGGGGGGYYGGGGGAGSCGDTTVGGGGGGSSYAEPSATVVTMTAGVQSGNGQITIWY